MDPRELDRLSDMEEGRKAQVLLDQIKPYLDAMDAQMMQTFRECPVRDQEGMTLIKLQMNALVRLEHNIRSVITTGKMAEMERQQ